MLGGTDIGTFDGSEVELDGWDAGGFSGSFGDHALAGPRSADHDDPCRVFVLHKLQELFMEFLTDTGIISVRTVRSRHCLLELVRPDDPSRFGAAVEDLLKESLNVSDSADILELL